MKDHSFYQFALTARGRKDDKGELAEDISMTYRFQNMKVTSTYYQTISKCKVTLRYLCPYLMIYMKNIQNG